MIQPVSKDERLRLAHVQDRRDNSVPGEPLQRLYAPVPLDQHVPVRVASDHQDGHLLPLAGEGLLEASAASGISDPESGVPEIEL